MTAQFRNVLILTNTQYTLNKTDGRIFYLFQIKEGEEDVEDNEDILAGPSSALEEPDNETEQDRFLSDPMLKAYVASQAGWSEEVETHWANKRARLLSRVFLKCAGPEVESCLQAVTTEEVMDLIEKHLKDTSKQQPALCKSTVLAILQFCRFAHGRTPQSRPALQSAISRAEEWKVKATKEDRKREAKLQGRMSEEHYLPSKEELKKFREKADQELQAFLRGARRPNYANAVQLR